MFENLCGKRLLYLGGIKRAAYVVKRAKELGIYVVVADYNEDSPAKLVADEGVLVDAMDADAIESLCLEKKIDGIMTGYADILMPVCHEVSKRLGLPCYYTEKMLRASTDKIYFKEMCNQNGVPVPKTYEINSQEIDKSAKELNYPVFIKPMDASGSRGARVCYDAQDFIKNYQYALSFSKKGIVTVEEFLHGTEFILDYLILNGHPYLLSMADRYTADAERGAVNSPDIMVLPSKYLKKYKEEVDTEVCEMLKRCSDRDGLVFFQGYANEEGIIFYEMGCRLGGTWPYIDEYFIGYNPLDLLFNQAIENTMLAPEYEEAIDAAFDGMGGIIYFLAGRDEGKIGKVVGIEEVKSHPGVVDVMQYYFEGDTFDLDRQTDIRFLSVHFVADSFEQLQERFRYIYSKVNYYDEDGKSLIADHYDINRLNGYGV